jgi:hypothetical protein
MAWLDRFRAKPLPLRITIIILSGIFLLLVGVIVFSISESKLNSPHTIFGIFLGVALFILTGMFYTNLRNIYELRDYIERLNLNAKPPRFWGGIMCYRRLKCNYKNRNFILTSEGDEENLVLKFPLKKKKPKLLLYSESMISPTTLLLNYPILKNAFTYSLPDYSQKIVYKYGRGEKLPDEILKNLLEFARFLSDYNGNFYLDERKLKLVFPAYPGIDEKVIEKAVEVVEKIENLIS